MIVEKEKFINELTDYFMTDLENLRYIVNAVVREYSILQYYEVYDMDYIDDYFNKPSMFLDSFSEDFNTEANHFVSPPYEGVSSLNVLSDMFDLETVKHCVTEMIENFEPEEIPFEPSRADISSFLEFIDNELAVGEIELILDIAEASISDQKELDDILSSDWIDNDEGDI
jgi:hypothetical protein